MAESTESGQRDLRDAVVACRAAARTLAALGADARRDLLAAVAEALANPDNRARIDAANAKDMAAAEEAQARGDLDASLVKRLGLSPAKIENLVAGLNQLAFNMPELVGQVSVRRLLDDGLELKKVSCPLGVVGVVFEARPDALVQIAGLALKSGNALVLKGGSEAIHSNRALVTIIHEVLAAKGLNPAAVLLLEGRNEVYEVLQLEGLVDIMIARGGAKFIHFVRENSKIPVMSHADGICHQYLHGESIPPRRPTCLSTASSLIPRRVTPSKPCCGSRVPPRPWRRRPRLWCRRV